MKISAENAVIISRILERYYIYADKFMSSGFGNHPESLRNKNLFLETADDLNLISTIYPAFSGGRSIQDGVSNRVKNSQLPNPKISNSFGEQLLPEAPPIEEQSK